MSYIPTKDNIFQEGTIINAKAFPDLKLRIMRYYQRIYYCAVIDQPARKQLAYFERELIAPLVAKMSMVL